MILHSKVSGDVGGGGGSYITRPTRREKLYDADLAIYVYHNGEIEIGKNRNGKIGPASVEDAVFYFSKILAQLKLKDTQLDMFKEGLFELLYESITNVLKGNHNERTICSKSTGNGSNSDRGT
jgi:hypothetical protein